MKVGQLHTITIEQTNRTDTRCRQINSGRTTQTADTNDQDTSVLQFLLCQLIEAVKLELSLVAEKIVCCHGSSSGKRGHHSDFIAGMQHHVIVDQFSIHGNPALNTLENGMKC